jgi:phosphotransferase system enzyme I (PtsI)
MEVLKGIPVSPGIAIGRVFILDDVRTRIPRRAVPANAVEREKQRLTAALDAARDELVQLSRQAEHQLGADAAKIFGFHLGMLGDKSLTEPILNRIEKERVTAEFAAQEQFVQLAQVFSGMADSFRSKVDDIWDIERRLIKHLIGEHASGLARLSEPSIVVAPDLTPSQTATFQGRPVIGFSTDYGGLTSHTAIFARALSIPAVVGVGRITQVAEDGDPVIVDGDRGVVILRPDAHTVTAYEANLRRAEVEAAALREIATLPAFTKDGVEVDLLGNIEFAGEVDTVLSNGGVGVGLFRTEFLWLTSDHEPTEEEQFTAYRTCVELARGGPVTLRTFDLGADKQASSAPTATEPNPFLGCRSIRYCLQNLTLFKRQLRAILRASAFGPLKIMFPLVTTLAELRQAKLHLRDVMEDLQDEGIVFDPKVPIGIMVEVPAAALMAGSFVREVDFLSIGTNDLIQYTLAVDRTNEKVQNLYTAGHPAVLKLVKDVVRAGRRGGVPVSCCGEVAGDPEYTMLLLGLGLRSLSATPGSLPALKRVIRNVDMTTCDRLARTACSFDSERQVTAYLRDQARKILPGSLGGRSAEDGLDF